MANFDLDHAYLRQAVGTPLTEAMAQLAILQPEDPVEFLGNYLLKHAANVEAQQKLTQRQQNAEGKTPLQPPVGAFQSEESNQQLEWEKLMDEEKVMMEQLRSEPSVAWVFQRFLEWLCSTLDAEEAYVGRKCVDPQGNPVVHFVASSRHPESKVVDKFVAQPPEDEEEVGKRGVGVTFDVFIEIAAVQEDGSPVLDSDGNPLPPAPLKYLLVENVLREPRVKFFGVPKLGALLTRAGQYKTYLHADVLNESNPEEPNVLEQWLVFSVDTMGQARVFTKTETERFRHATELFLTTLEEKERELYMKDYERRVPTDEPLLREFLVAFAAQVAVQEENLVAQFPAPADGEEPSEAAQQQRATKEAEFRLDFLTALLISHIPTLSIASTRVVPFKSLALSTFAVALEMLGYARRELYNPATGQPSWDKIAPLLKEANLTDRLNFFAKTLETVDGLAATDSTTASGLRAARNALPIPPTVVARAKETITEIVKVDVDAASPVASCFYVWAQAVIARAENLTLMKGRAQELEDEAAAAAAAAVEGGDE